MAQIIRGERVGAQGKIRVGCSAAIFGEGDDKILLARRSDNGLWHMAGGGLEPGESAAEACAREIREELGLEIEVGRLIATAVPGILVFPVAGFVPGHAYSDMVTLGARAVNKGRRDSRGCKLLIIPRGSS